MALNGSACGRWIRDNRNAVNGYAKRRLPLEAKRNVSFATIDNNKDFAWMSDTLDRQRGVGRNDVHERFD